MSAPALPLETQERWLKELLAGESTPEGRSWYRYHDKWTESCGQHKRPYGALLACAHVGVAAFALWYSEASSWFITGPLDGADEPVEEQTFLAALHTYHSATKLLQDEALRRAITHQAAINDVEFNVPTERWLA